jgi:hypothetical protein
MTDTQRVIREAIRQILLEHVQGPFVLIREAGLQARLWSILRQNLTPALVNSEISAKSPLHQHTTEFQTSRVQLELKVGGPEKSDIVVFRADRRPRLTCWPAGPTDVVAKVEPDDVEAVIEIKAAPSQAREQRAAFADDILKLEELHAKHPQLACFFVLVDKSLSVPGAVCESSQVVEGRAPRDLREDAGSNAENRVEVWDLTCCPDPMPRVRLVA